MADEPPMDELLKLGVAYLSEYLGNVYSRQSWTVLRIRFHRYEVHGQVYRGLKGQEGLRLSRALSV